MVQAGWNGMDQIYREYPLRAGRVNELHRLCAELRDRLFFEQESQSQLALALAEQQSAATT